MVKEGGMTCGTARTNPTKYLSLGQMFSVGCGESFGLSMCKRGNRMVPVHNKTDNEEEVRQQRKDDNIFTTLCSYLLRAL